MKIRIDPLDKLFSSYIRARDNVCQRCGSSGNLGSLQCAHFFGRARRSTRWDEENACALCFGCHQYFGSHPLEFVEWFKARLGDSFELLEGRMRITYPRPDKELLTLYFKAKIKELVEIQE